MKLLLYVSETGEVEERLRKVFQAKTQDTEWEICPTIGSLSHVLRRYSPEIDVAILVASNVDDLLELHSIANLLSYLRLILILPDQNKETLTHAHKLKPRFFTYMDSSFHEIAVVLERMLTK
jgi:hypothetical protein